MLTVYAGANVRRRTAHCAKLRVDRRCREKSRRQGATPTEIIIEEVENHPEILDDPGPSVRLIELGDSSVGLQSRIWIDDPGRADSVETRSEYVTSVKERFDAADINIPYPNRTIGGDLALSNVQQMVEPADD